MKTLRISFSLAMVSLALASFVRAEDKKPAPAGKNAACCEKAAADGKACEHGCCVTAAKDGKHCEKCGGTNEKKS